MLNYNNNDGKSVNIIDQTQAIYEAMQQAGLPCSDTLVVDGNIHRYSSRADKKKDEWYVIYNNCFSSKQYLYALFGSWRANENIHCNTYSDVASLTSQERDEFNQQIKKMKEEVANKLIEQHELVAKKACKLWDESYVEAPSEEYNAYSTFKKINPLGARFCNNINGYPSMILPLKNNSGEIRSLQFISFDALKEKSYKSFLDGGEKKGNYMMLGDPDKMIYIVEGYATGVSVYMSAKQAVVVAFDAYNLTAVAENIKQLYSNVEIIIAGDNDKIGKEMARIAAQKINGKAFFTHEEGKDYNDIFIEHGAEEVVKQLSSPVSNDSDNKADEAPEEDLCRDFNLNDLPEPLRNYINALSDGGTGHPILFLTSILGVASAIVGTKMGISWHGNMILRPNLWTMCIASSGEHKTTSMTSANRYIRERHKRVLDDLLQFKNSVESSGKLEDKESISEEKRIMAQSPFLPERSTADAFLEALSHGQRGTLFLSEVGPWLELMEKQFNSGFKGNLTDLYDCPESWSTRTKGKGYLTIMNPFFSICAYSTSVWLNKNTKADDLTSGFYARFLFFRPKFKDRGPSKMPTAKNSGYNSGYNDFKDFMDSACNNIDQFRIYTVSLEVEKYINECFENLYRQRMALDDPNERLTPFFKRWEAYLLKLAMLIRFFECPDSAELSISSVTTAMSIIYAAFRSTVHLFSNEITDSHQKQCSELLAYIKKHAKKGGTDYVSRSKIIASNCLAGGVKVYDDILATLQQSGKIRIEKSSTEKLELTKYWPIS